MSGGSICVQACAGSHPADPVTIHALPGFWPGLTLGLLLLVFWVSTRFQPVRVEDDA